MRIPVVDMIAGKKKLFLLSIGIVFVCLSFAGSSYGSTGPGKDVADSFTQCANDPDNSGLVEQCQWITGALVTNNSLYAESDGVPQRWLLQYESKGLQEAHTAVFQYTFTKNSVYAYDFLNSVNHTMPSSLINECGDLPPFANQDDCVSTFSAAGGALNGINIPFHSDPFDAVAAREHPPVRYLHFGCIQEGTSNPGPPVPGCDVANVTIDPPVHSVASCFQNCGDSDATVTVHFTTNADGSVQNPVQKLIGMWFAAQLADSADPDGLGPAIGWGTGFGSSSAPGSSFHVTLISFDGKAVGGRDNQINSDVIATGHHTDLGVTKSCPDTIHAGNNVSYTITVTNNGPETATGVFIDDTLPLQTGVTFVSATPGQGTCNPLVGTLLHCDIGFMQPGDSATITVVINVASTFLGGSITDSVTVGGPVVDSVTSNNTDSCTTTILPPVGPPIDLSVSKTCPPDPTIAGVPTNLSYTVTVTNNDSTNTATGVTLTDSLPGGVTFVSATPSQGSCSQSAGVVTCPLLSITAGSSATVTIVVAAPTSPSFRGPLTNVATVSADQSDNTTNNNTSSCTNTVTGQTDIAIVKECPGSATEGGLITYHITVSNAGPSTSLDTHIEDILPNDGALPTPNLLVSFISASPSQGSCTFILPDNVHCTLGSILPAGSATVDIVVQPNSGTGGSTLTNIAQTHIHPPDEDTNHNNDSLENDFSCQTCSCGTTVSSPPQGVDLQVTKQDSPDPVLAGENLTYTIVVTNSSAGTDATGVTLTDTLPPGVTFVSATASPQGSCSQLAGVVTCNLGTLTKSPPNASNPITVTIVVAVNPSTRGTLTNTAVVAGNETESDAGPPDTNNTATTTTQVNAKVGLFITKQDGPDPALNGDTLTYTIVAGNIGPSDATNVQVVDTLPPGAVSFVSASATQGSCTNNGDISVTCNLGTITPGNSVAITISVKITLVVLPGGSTVITNIADVTSTEDPNDVQTQDDTTIDGPFVAVPTLSEWGMLIFMLLAGLGSVYHLRRQRRV